MNGDEHILELIRAGETSQVEFKSSLRFDLRERKVNKDLTQVIAKTIAGFLNAEGGILLIGVADDGAILGIESDLRTLSRQSHDGFEQALRMAVGTFLGVDVSAAIAVTFHVADEKTIARVFCRKHHVPVLLKSGESVEFYVRDGNTTRRLNVLEAHRYISARDLEITKATIKEAVGELLDHRDATWARDIKIFHKLGDRLLRLFSRIGTSIPLKGHLIELAAPQQHAPESSAAMTQPSEASARIPPLADSADAARSGRLPECAVTRVGVGTPLHNQSLAVASGRILIPFIQCSCRASYQVPRDSVHRYASSIGSMAQRGH